MVLPAPGYGFSSAFFSGLANFQVLLTNQGYLSTLCPWVHQPSNGTKDSQVLLLANYYQPFLSL